MNCPTCKQDRLAVISSDTSYCVVCGTLVSGEINVVPELVDRCRAFVYDETTAALESIKQAIGMGD